MSRLFDFTHLWLLDAPVATVVGVLADPLGYPGWWPQIRSAEPVEPPEPVAPPEAAEPPEPARRTTRSETEAVRVVARSILPYPLRLLLTRRREDRAAGVLEAGLTGDLDGWSRMVVFAGEDGRTRVSYRQRVVVTAGWPAPLIDAFAPMLMANHAWMMRAGERGLRRAVRFGDDTARQPTAPPRTGGGHGERRTRGRRARGGHGRTRRRVGAARGA